MTLSTILEAIAAEIETARPNERLRNDQIDRIERLLLEMGEFPGPRGEMQRLLAKSLAVHRARNGRSSAPGIALAYDHVLNAWDMLYPEMNAVEDRVVV